MNPPPAPAAEILSSENASSYGNASVIKPSPAFSKLHHRLSIVRIAALLVVGVLSSGLGYVMAPPEVVLMEPKDEDLVVLNGCVVSACGYMASVRAQHKLDADFWSRVMLVRYKGNSAGHAYCVWQTDGQIFGYDRAGGSFSIPGNTRDPMSIAEALAGGVEKVTKRPMVVERAAFIEPKTAKLYAF